MRIAVIAAAMCLSIVGISNAQDAKAAIKMPTNIPAQGLGPALKAFAQSRDLQVLYFSGLVKDLKTEGASGELTTDEALTKLLGGTGLTYKYVDDKAVTILPKAAGGAGIVGEDAKAAKAKTAELTKEGEEKRDSSSHDFRVAQVGQASAGPQAVEEKKEDKLKLEEIVVTGTHIRGIAPDSQPLITYDRAAIDNFGVATVNELVTKLPENFGLISASTALNNGLNSDALGNSSLATTVDLHGLGTGATLVLLNGHRVAPSGSDGDFVDVSLFPMNAIDHIDVLSDGASAIYGADAVAGVVNFVLKKDFDGAETSIRYGGTTAGGGKELVASQSLGKSWRSGNAMLVYEHSDQGSIDASERSYILPQGGPFTLEPNQKRDSVLGSMRLEITENLSAHTDWLFSDRRFDQFDTLLGTYLIGNSGSARNVTGSATLDVTLPSQWHAGLTGDYSNELDKRASTFNGMFTGSLDLESKVADVELSADGPLFSVPAGVTRVSLGASFRREEEFQDGINAGAAVGLARNISGTFAELNFPIVSDSNSVMLVRRLELNVAARYDHYSDFGGSTDPKASLLWSPTSGVKLRATWARSYRAPPLAQLVLGNEYEILDLSNPQSPSGITTTLVPQDPGNPGLGPERSRSVTAGFDVVPVFAPALALSGTYFDVRFQDRIARPINLAGSDLSNIYFNQSSLAPFTEFAPPINLLDQIFTTGTITNLSSGPGTPASIGAMFDARLHNIAATRQSGFDFSAKYHIALRYGELSTFVGGSRILHNEYENVVGGPTTSRLNLPFNPVSLRFRTGASWEMGRLYVAANANYTGGYVNDLVSPSQEIPAWVTADTQLRYLLGGDTGSSISRGLALTLDVQNIFDRKPPFLAQDPTAFYNLGYDAANASAMGRLISLQMRKRW